MKIPVVCLPEAGATLAVVPVENGSAAKNRKRARGGREI